MKFRDSPEVTLSIVSHGQGALVCNLLKDISLGTDVNYRIILTLNISEDESFLDEFADLPLTIIRNRKVKGFGANHNAAFRRCDSVFFAIVNPDIRANPLSIRPLLDLLAAPDIGACGPAVFSASGVLEDSARFFPTFSRLFWRRVRKVRNLDYRLSNSPLPVDWIAGMFVVVKSTAFADIGGFDERYFMYLEDTDLCRRLRLKGFQVVLQPAAAVVHDAQRASRKSFRHLLWHCQSALRFLLSGYAAKY